MKEQLALGINMQMFFYLFALTDEKGGRYGGCVPAGALYIPPMTAWQTKRAPPSASTTP